jgi:F-type H+-transporting ATPase subunit alpha
VALVLAVQAGLLDPLPLPGVIEFRRGLGAALDQDAPKAVSQIQETGTLDDALKQSLSEVLKKYAASMTPKQAAQP